LGDTGYEMDEARPRGIESLRMLISHNADGMVVIDPEGHALLVNPAAEALLGRTSEELLGQQFGLPMVKGATTEVDVLRSDGTVLVTEMRVAEIRWDGRPASLATLRDVTERKRRHAHMAHVERMASVGTLAAGVAHEVNNPLTYVIFNLQWLERTLPKLADALQACRTGTEVELPDSCRPEAVRKMAEGAARAAEGAGRIRDIVRTLTGFSRNDVETTSPVDVNAAAEAAVQMAQNEIRYRAMLVRDFASSLPVLADEGRITQVILNLLINAAQAIPDGASEENEISARTFDRGNEVVVEVHDTGVGIPGNLVPKIFEPFYTTKPAGQGSGLGLAICHNIVESARGHIEVESVQGKGTCFRVCFPAMTEHVSPPVAPSKLRSEPPLDGRRPRVLVVDDEPMVGEIVDATLGGEFDVVLVDSGVKARELLQSGREFDVILSDLLMPGVSGMDLYAWMESEHPTYCGRTSFMTGGAFTPKAAEFLARMDGRCVKKPFDMRALLNFVRAAAKRSALP
jgi:signal transduction histidine kinase